jgi:DNA adenine methylase
MTPFFKAVGGKRQLLPELRKYIPKEYGRYFEPFVGGGALFFDLQPKAAFLNDANPHMMAAYIAVRDHLWKLLDALRRHERAYRAEGAEHFYRIRAIHIDPKDTVGAAARFILLNKTGFNGLYRVNKDNRFNVPFGRYENPRICDVRALRTCSLALAHTELKVGDFERIAARAKRGDFVYFDPPYAPLSATSSFTSYTSKGFGIDEQTRLRDLARNLKKRGVHVLLSNSSAPSVRDLYARGFETIEVRATRRVNSRAAGRGAITEIVIT